jgi:hypothetical protein
MRRRALLARAACPGSGASQFRAAENILPACHVLDSASWLSEHVPLRQEAQFLRERARRLREIAGAHRTSLSQQLRAMAAELEGRADELEKSRPGD